MNQVAKREAEPSTAVVVMTPMDMLDRAVAQGANVEVLEKLMGLQERWEANQARKAFDDAMAQAKTKLPAIVKDKAVRFDANKPPSFMHETLSGIAKLIDPVLAAHGLAYRFRTSSDATTATVTCVIHGHGHSEENSLSGPHDKSGGKNSIQAVGSSVTYLQRYTLKAALGIAAADDDNGNAAGAGETIEQKQCEDLDVLIAEVGADKGRFCKHFKIESLAGLPLHRLPEATALLEAKRK